MDDVFHCVTATAEYITVQMSHIGVISISAFSKRSSKTQIYVLKLMRFTFFEYITDWQLNIFICVYRRSFVDQMYPAITDTPKKLHFNWYDGSRFPKETGVDQTRRQSSAEMIHDTGPSELGFSWSSCPKMRSTEPASREMGAGCQTDENRYYTLILARRP